MAKKKVVRLKDYRRLVADSSVHLLAHETGQNLDELFMILLRLSASGHIQPKVENNKLRFCLARDFAEAKQMRKAFLRHSRGLANEYLYETTKELRDHLFHSIPKRLRKLKINVHRPYLGLWNE